MSPTARPALLETATPTSGTGQRIQRFSTLSQPPGDRFGYWCALHPRAVLELPNPSHGATFRGDMLLHVDPDGVAFSDYACDAVTVRFGQLGSDAVMLACHWSGATRVRIGSGQTHTVLPDSGLYIVDAAKPVTVATQGHALGFISLPRERVTAELGHDLSYLDPGFISLGQDGLAGFLVEHMRRMRQLAPSLDPAEVAAVMQAGVTMALACLDGASGSSPAVVRSADALFQAAQRHIARHASDETLTATTIAETLGCSRAHLYRVFAIRGETVAAALRRARLDRARELLATYPPASVDQVALGCGYRSADSLSRAFRQHFGFTPAQWRNRRL